MDDRERPLLSNVIIGRNDDYGRYYLERLQTALNFLGETLRVLGRLDQVEVVYVDWGSDEPVADNVDLTASAASLVRFVEVPARDVREKWERDGFSPVLAANVGVRRAAGKFIMLTDSDCVMPRFAMAALLRFLDETFESELPRRKMIFPIRRAQVPSRIFARRPSISKWVEILDRLLPGARAESPSAGCLGGFSAGQLMHRDLWHELRGYNDRLTRPWGWSDNEIMMRVTSRYDWTDLIRYGVMAFHIEHGDYRRFWRHDGDVVVPKDPSRINRMRVEQDLAPSSEDWGCADIVFPERRVIGRRNEMDRVETDANEGLRGLKHNLGGEGVLKAALRSSVIKSTVKRISNHCVTAYGRKTDTTEQRLVAALTAFIMEANPINLVYWGRLSEPVLYAALAEHSAIQAYLVNSWTPGETDDQPCNPAVLSQVLEHARYRGFARFAMGKEAAVLEQIERSDMSFRRVELAVLHYPARDETTGRCLEIGRRLAPGGAMFVVGLDAVEFVQGWHGIPWQQLGTGYIEAKRDQSWTRWFAKPEPVGPDALQTLVLNKKLAMVMRQPRNS